MVLSVQIDFWSYESVTAASSHDFLFLPWIQVAISFSNRRRNSVCYSCSAKIFASHCLNSSYMSQSLDYPGSSSRSRSLIPLPPCLRYESFAVVRYRSPIRGGGESLLSTVLSTPSSIAACLVAQPALPSCVSLAVISPRLSTLAWNSHVSSRCCRSGGESRRSEWSSLHRKYATTLFQVAFLFISNYSK